MDDYATDSRRAIVPNCRSDKQQPIPLLNSKPAGTARKSKRLAADEDGEVAGGSHEEEHGER